MKSRTGSNAMKACLLALLAMGAVALVEAPRVDADEWFDFELDLKDAFGKKPIKGAPFSAKLVFEINQTLANGVRVTKKSAAALFRDIDGRTRQEFLREGAPETVVINDNVAGVFYHLNMAHHTANKVNLMDEQLHREMEERHQKREHEERRQMEEHHRKHNEGIEKMKGLRLKRPEFESERKVESLGFQNVEGVQAEGTRVTITVPAETEDNDKPFEIVTEKWYSPELQIVVMGKQTDPRIGETVYRLTNINRSDPARSLFEAPADFTVIEEQDLEIKHERKAGLNRKH